MRSFKDSLSLLHDFGDELEWFQPYQEARIKIGMPNKVPNYMTKNTGGAPRGTPHLRITESKTSGGSQQKTESRTSGGHQHKTDSKTGGGKPHSN